MKVRDAKPSEALSARQRELYDAAIRLGSQTAARRATGATTGSMSRAVAAAEASGLPPVPRLAAGRPRRPQPTPASPGASENEGAMPGIRVPAGSERDETGRLRPIGTNLDGGRLEPLVTPPGELDRRQATDDERAGFRPAAWTQPKADDV